MKKILVGTFLSAAMAYMLASISLFFFDSASTPVYEHPSGTSVSQTFAGPLNISQKTIRQTEQTDRISNWVLSGTVLGEDPIAMLVSGNNFKILHMDEKLESYRLTAVDNGRIRLSNNEKDIWLYMKNQKFEKKVANPAAKANTNQSFNRNIPKNKFSGIMKNPERLMMDINIMPVMENGNLKGFKVNNLRSRSDIQLFSGLQKGDIITSINGKKITSAANAISQYQKIMGMKKFSLTVIRENEERTINYDIR